jgi:hypothetical protein
MNVRGSVPCASGSTCSDCGTNFSRIQSLGESSISDMKKEEKYEVLVVVAKDVSSMVIVVDGAVTTSATTERVIHQSL